MPDKATSSPLLYLYGGVGLVSLLKRSRIPMQQDWSFLHPFLGLGQWHSEPVNQVTDQDMEKGYRDEYEKLPDNVRLWLPFDSFRKQKGKLEAQVKAAILNRKASASQSKPGYPLARFNKTAYLRLFNAATIQLGWFELAEKFTGISLGVRQHASCFHAMPGLPVVLKPVQYGTNHQFQSLEDNPLPGAFMDVDEHKSFGEWRVIVPNRSSERMTLKLKRQDIQRIYYTVMTPDQTVDELHSLVEKDLNFRHVELYRVLPDANYWRLTAERTYPE